jgi:bifunctional UDP-N-acetylglucosamine pyrophosphorylase/glucosamine-1-phosphate N-acetyltransferase
MPYGRLVREGSKLVRIVEHADATEEQRAIADTNAGFYAIRLGDLRRDLAKLRADNAKGELYLTDLVAAAAARRGDGATAIDAPFTEVAGINDRVDLAGVEVQARRRINEDWMRAGVTMIDPATTYIDADVGPIGEDVWIGPNVALRGKTSIASGVRIDLGCVLTDVKVAEHTYIKPHSVLGDATIGARVQIGPFSHCRPGTRLDDDVRLGNFVETKKSHLMAGAKANHLAYLGDASVGSRANIGAGTITCNYDGVGKYRTTIEAGAFIGSDSQLVAPVTVGRDAYVGSGTTVTKDVPRGALALTRVKQVNVEGWADRFREAQAKRKQKLDGNGH